MTLSSAVPVQPRLSGARRQRIDHQDLLWRQRRADMPPQVECSRPIAAEHVRQALRRIPGLAAAAPVPPFRSA